MPGPAPPLAYVRARVRKANCVDMVEKRPISIGSMRVQARNANGLGDIAEEVYWRGNLVMEDGAGAAGIGRFA